MARTNIVTADFSNSSFYRTASLYQYDYGQILKFSGIESLPDSYEVYFSNEQNDGEATAQIGNANGVVIPDIYLTTGKTIYAWMVLHTGENDGEVVYTVYIPVIQRSEPTNAEPTPVQQDVITQTIAVLNTAVERAETAQDAWENMTAQAETLAPESEATASYADGVLTLGIPEGKQGEQGNTGNGIASTILNPDYTLTINFTDGTSYTTASIRGAQGNDGDDGVGIASTMLNADYTLTITLTDGTSYTTPSIRGQKGEKGDKGNTPTITTQKSGRTTTIYADGVAVGTVEDGENGRTPVITASKSGSVTTIYADSTAIATINDGQDGYTPIIGIDYWTSEDKAEIVDDVLDSQELSDALDDKAPVIINTASGAIVSFADGADDMPVKKCLVDIEPVQDLHGYDKPYPPGGSTNKYNEETKTVGQILNISNGKVSNNASWEVSDFIPASSGEITLTWDSPSIFYQARICSYDASKNFIADSGTVYAGIVYSYTFTAPSGTAFVRFSWSFIVNGTEYPRTNVRVNVGATDLGFEPYSNICPITGWDGVNVVSSPTTDEQDGETYSISWQSEAGTVYGGRIDVVSGELIVDRAEIDSYNGETLPSTWISDRDVYAEGTSPSTGAQVVYALAEPLIYHLTPTEIRTLLGTNNIWADTGDTEVTYCADTKEYVDGHGKVTDVQINGTSIVSDGVAEIPVADANTAGVVKAHKWNDSNNITGILLDGNNVLCMIPATLAEIKSAVGTSSSLIPYFQHASTFYGLAKASGDTTQSASNNAVGTYTEDAKSKINDMLNSPITVSGTTPTITAKSGIRYTCGEVATLDFTPSSTGICDVVFTSGATATVLTVPSTVKFPEWFDATALEANTVYEINIMDGIYGVVMMWAV